MARISFEKIEKVVSVPFRGSCSEIIMARMEVHKQEQVSVPFRGSCSEMIDELNTWIPAKQVSVPFRGSCSEIACSRITQPTPPCFRPLSGFVF